jgi:UDPglucose 6-dehydrogenase
MSELKILKGRKIGLLGLSFKPFTDDLRDAPAFDIANRLIERGAKVVAFDPISMERAKKEWKGSEIEYLPNAEAVFSEADAVLLVTEWPEFKGIPFGQAASSMKNRLIIDGRGLMDPAKMSACGIRLITLGKSSR